MYRFNYYKRTWFTPVFSCFWDRNKLSSPYGLYHAEIHISKIRTKNFKKSFYKDFNKESLLQDLQPGLNNIGKFAEFNDEFKAILNHHAPIKQSKLRGHTKPRINKTLRKKNNEKIYA